MPFSVLLTVFTLEMLSLLIFPIFTFLRPDIIIFS